MKRSKYMIIISLFVITIMLLSACGEKKQESAANADKPAETTVVLETRADGGTLEQDAEGNKITKDEKGNVLSVEDKDGKPVDVEEYISTHTWVVNNDSAGNSDGSEKNTGSDGSSSSNHSDSSGSSGDSEGKSSSDKGSETSDGGSSDREEIVEESIPVALATVPDEEDMEKIPDF